jgi:hypothetical protein
VTDRCPECDRHEAFCECGPAVVIDARNPGEVTVTERATGLAAITAIRDQLAKGHRREDSTPRPEELTQ